MNTEYSIQPVTITVSPTLSYTATKIAMGINYNPSVTDMPVWYSLQDDSYNTYYEGSVVITESELALWGTDDMYIVNLVASKVGVTLV